MPTSDFLAAIRADFIDFKEGVDGQIESILGDLTDADIEVEATSAHYYECDGITVAVNSSEFSFENLSVESFSNEQARLLVNANVSCDISADFSLSHHDSIDGDMVSIPGTSETQAVDFDANVLIEVNLYEDGDYDIESVRVSGFPTSVDFGDLESDW